MTAMPHFGSGAILPRHELASLEKAAKGGNGVAAYRVAAHYGLGVGDAKKARFYRNLAVAAEYPPALYAEAIWVWEQKRDKAEAGRLLRRAIELGHQDAARLADDLQEGESPKPNKAR